MSEIRVDKVADEAGTGAVELTQGATLPSGKTLSGSGTIAVNSSGTAAGLTGTPTITVADITGIGLNLTGITTTAGIKFNKEILEEVNVTGGKLSDNTNIDVANGQVHLFTTAESTTSTPNIRYDGSTTLNSKMSVGQSLVVTIITTANASAYSANITIDGSAVTENWIGGSAPSGGGSSGVDIHSFTIIKTADATFTVIGNHSKTS